MMLDQALSAELAGAVARYVLPEDQPEFIAAVQGKAEVHYRDGGHAAAMTYIERVIGSLETEFNQFDLFRDTG